VIENEIIPLVEHEYRGDPSYRALAGSSLGGLFTLYAMLARPGLFTAYVAPSPAAQWAEDWLLGFEEEFHRSGQPLGARLFMTYAEKDPAMILDGVKRFDARLRERAYPGFRLRIPHGRRRGPQWHQSRKLQPRRTIRFLTPGASRVSPLGT
jgi:enterochelin esterase-like enzyme